MGRTRGKLIYVRLTAQEHMVIENMAKQQCLTVAAFVRTVVLERGEIAPFFSDDDRLLLFHLLEKLRIEGFNLTSVLIALNRDERFVDAPFKREIRELQRAMAALSMELSAHAKKTTTHRRRS